MATLDAPGREAVAAVLRRLPILPDRESTVESWARRIAFVGSVAAGNELPRARRTGTRAALAEINALAMAALKLRNTALSLHRDALAALEGKKARHPLRLADDLAALVNACNAAAGELQAEAPAKAPGQKTKPAAAAVTREAALAFESLTGKAPTITTNYGIDGSTAGGAWLDMLGGLFEACGVKASPEAQAKAMEKPGRKSHR